ncbi:hypothetical protein EYB53_003310 [Candidatus Chloroploca sp. M-50]|uniref:Transcriptional regulator HTH-type FeoC domain-containing protein n=2 Tax=Candidatus Chloroploca TaxID=1579476 RepID=A0A2H3KWP4_9CHLR|nr:MULTISPECIES: FeoC-like transcriptional regulator [Candidatus Chloroploca]MBP1464732.1 hypothetical protein [Candidatus Chloroploca mongolica]PDV99819.1 hypothetical protein A9Q02_00990 [Candidatus Chloroploca asiatica]
MLQKVLQALEETQGPVSLDELSRQLELDVGVLEGMIDFWVRKGKLKDSRLAACAGGCGNCNPGAQGCTFDRGRPRSITLT